MATTMIGAGQNAAAVSEALGHVTVGFTLTTYVHSGAEMGAPLAAAAEEAHGGPSEVFELLSSWRAALSATDSFKPDWWDRYMDPQIAPHELTEAMSKRLGRFRMNEGPTGVTMSPQDEHAVFVRSRVAKELPTLGLLDIQPLTDRIVRNIPTSPGLRVSGGELFVDPIALALAANCPSSSVLATDISFRALRCARMNARRTGVRGVQFLQGDLLDPLAPVSLGE
jgi:hypothetical protein